MRIAPVVALATLLAASTQQPSVLGTYRGTSICTAVGKPACHDEVVVYHLTADSAAPNDRTRVAITANKMVNGVEEDMGVLNCSVDSAVRRIRCPMRDWLWSFRIQGGTLSGTLTNPTGIVWRNVRVARVGSP